MGAVRPTQGKTLAVMQVSGGSQSFNAVNQMRVLGRWMRMLTIPNQSSVAKAYQEFDEDGRMKPSPYYDRIVDVVEELVKFTLLTRDAAPYLVDRYSERRKPPPPCRGGCGRRPSELPGTLPGGRRVRVSGPIHPYIPTNARVLIKHNI